jgi:hypothetical protein
VQGAGNIKEHLLLELFGFLNKGLTSTAIGPREFQVIHTRREGKSSLTLTLVREFANLQWKEEELRHIKEL